jgi:DNA-binding response OmpR family regulator
MSLSTDVVARAVRPELLQWHPKSRAITIKDKQIDLTRTEYQLLVPLGSGLPVTYAELTMRVYHCQVDPKIRTMMDKHIDRIRGKLRGSGLYVYCVLGYGYIMLPEMEPPARQSSLRH